LFNYLQIARFVVLLALTTLLVVSMLDALEPRKDPLDFSDEIILFGKSDITISDRVDVTKSTNPILRKLRA
jgi:hypothetical protein